MKAFPLPTLVISEERCRQNIRMMASKAGDKGLCFRPHFKTHQSHEIGGWFREEGVEKITVSSLDMAEYFIKDGWKDITIAFPVNILDAARIKALNESADLIFCAVDPVIVPSLGKLLKKPAGLMIEIDSGYHRSGIPWNDFETIDELAGAILKIPGLILKGFLTHAGHTYSARSREEIVRINMESKARMVNVKERYKTQFPEIMISCGDTPSSSISDDFDGIDEIRPGNFVFYDAMQMQIGSCSINEIAVVMSCPVVTAYPHRNEVVVHGGAIHFSKDSIELNRYSLPSFGLGVNFNPELWNLRLNGNNLISISQEHGLVRIDPGQEFPRVGQCMFFIPVHSCLTAAAMRRYYTIEGKEIKTMNS